MSRFLAIPVARLPEETLYSLLEEFASRDGTDYGERELSLTEKVANLQNQLNRGDLTLLFDTDGEQWDLLPRDQADLLLDS